MTAARGARRFLTGFFVITALALAGASPSLAAAPSADLSISKTTGSGSTSPGASIPYSITVHNHGPDAAASAKMTDALPSQTVFVSISAPSGWSCSTPAVGTNGTVTCTTSSMASGDNATFSLQVQVKSNTASGTTITNTASVDSSTKDPDHSNNSGTAKTKVEAEADLSITKAATTSPGVAGATVNYTIDVLNSGPSPAVNVTMTDSIVPPETFRLVTPPKGWTCAPQFQAVTCTKASLPANEVDTIVVQVALSPDIPNFTTVQDTAKVSSDSHDAHPGDNSDTEHLLVVRRADLALTMSGHPHPVAPGHTIHYAIDVHSAGPSDAKKAKVADFVGGRKVFVSVSAPEGWSCSHPAVGETGAVRCTNPLVGPGEDDVIRLVVRVRHHTRPGTFVSNTATVSSPTPDPSGANNHDTVTVKVRNP
ncbi:MAG: DUF11 domain-containing protein [Actinomycetota bacterium]|nr:DUF11 domain-containing protein [Actinomycetota bacterium]